MDKDEITRLAKGLQQAKPSIRGVSTENGPKLVVEAFGFQEWYNVQYLNKVLDDVGLKVVKDDSSGSDSEGDAW